MSIGTGPTSADIGRYYDEVASHYSEAMGETLHFGYWDTPRTDDPLGTYPDARNHLTDLAIGRLGVGAGDRVLDVGCGMGGPALRLARASGARVVGVTVSGVQVERAEELAEAEGLGGRVGFQKADAMALPFPDGSFDAAWALESIVHMPDRAGALREAARVLRPGGRLILTDFIERSPVSSQNKALVDDYLRNSAVAAPISLDDYPALISGAGLVPTEVVDISANTMRNTFLALEQMWAALPIPPETRMCLTPLADVEELGYVFVVATLPAA